MATEAPTKTNCPNCGARLARQDLSLCAYCATPLQIGAKSAPASDETTLRLQRLREHAAWPQAMTWTPIEPDILDRTSRAKSIATLLFFLAAISVAIGIWRGATWNGPWMIAATVMATTAIALVLSASVARSRAHVRPMLRRPALVVSRGSKTLAKGSRGATTYYFLLRFDDGSEGEFSWRGQGTAIEPHPNGTTGIAYTRGERLIELRRL